MLYLAHELGMTVKELLARTNSAELTEWHAYFSMGADQAVLEDLKHRALGRLEQKTRRRRSSG